MKIRTIIKNLEKMENNREVLANFFRLWTVPVVKMELKNLQIHTITGKANDKGMTVRDAINFLKCLDKNINWQPITKVIKFNEWCVLMINN